MRYIEEGADIQICQKSVKELKKELKRVMSQPDLHRMAVLYGICFSLSHKFPQSFKEYGWSDSKLKCKDCGEIIDPYRVELVDPDPDDY